LRNYS